MDPRGLTRRPWLSPASLLGAGALVLAALGLWRTYRPHASGDPVATSLIAFERHDRLTVFSAQLAPVVSADDVRGLGVLRSRQVAVIPARVDYTLDLGQLDARRLAWDGAAQQLTVTLPPLQLSRPNLDEGRAQYLREGLWIGREAQAALTRDNTVLAERQAAQQAANPVLLALARDAAKAAVRQNLEIPLRAAGYPKVAVTVRFDGEPAN